MFPLPFSLCLLSFLAFPFPFLAASPSGHLPGLLQRRPLNAPRKVFDRSCRPIPPTLSGSCFPALGFQMPSTVPANTNGWWCNPDAEYAFLGFSYEVTPCESPQPLLLLAS
ncbi:hypothetical protein BC826DRAFT_1002623 [Russula brevipes]|nr:hypothetical protein BC826DRAFT_1002623 [Russula brevipes]